MSRFTNLTPLSSTTTSSVPRPYQPSLQPRTSSLRPHCLARDRLRLWVPESSRPCLDSSGSTVVLSDADLDRILCVIAHSHSPNTRECYGSGLLVYHVFCDSRDVPEIQRCPASSVLLLAFLASCAGLYSGATLDNYFYGIRAWHLLHGQPWAVDQAQVSLTLEGARRLAPAHSHRPKRSPVTINILLGIRSALDLTKPLHAAVYACLTTSFFSIARTGEFTLPSLKSFDANTHVKVSDVRYDTDRHGHQVTVFRLPRTKTTPGGEDVYWSSQSGLCDPTAALLNHFNVNTPAATDALFSWRHRAGIRVLTRSAFLKCINEASVSAGLGELKGHGIRIGGTLEYLLRGVPFESVKTMGRWSSNTFVLYLRKHAVIMAPYLQDQPLLEPFMRYALPS